jgi:hypothetical protein
VVVCLFVCLFVHIFFSTDLTYKDSTTQRDNFDSRSYSPKNLVMGGDKLFTSSEHSRGVFEVAQLDVDDDDDDFFA